jgi:Xaa-Pro aminopeptidase
MEKAKNRGVIKNAKVFMKNKEIDAWVLYDFKGSNPLFWRVIGKKLPTSRRCFFFIPRTGQPEILANVLDKELFSESDWKVIVYSSREEMEKKLSGLLNNWKTVAMEYSPRANIPYVGRVDAGTVELFREKGVDVVSSGDLFQYSAARWSKQELEAHLEAAKKIAAIKDEAFQFAGKRIASDKLVTEFDVQSHILEKFAEKQLITEEKPIVAVNENTARPHYEPKENTCAKIGTNDLLMVDLWAKTRDENGVFADITWVAYLGKEVPEKYVRIFDIVAEARDRVTAFLEKKMEKDEPCCGWELDKVARGFIEGQGFGNYFFHRTGHGIGSSVHGDSMNLDNYESKDTRLVIPGIGFSVEPGIYLNDWGIRSEINVYVDKKRPFITTSVQKAIVAI